MHKVWATSTESWQKNEAVVITFVDSRMPWRSPKMPGLSLKDPELQHCMQFQLRISRSHLWTCLLGQAAREVAFYALAWQAPPGRLHLQSLHACCPEAALSSLWTADSRSLGRLVWWSWWQIQAMHMLATQLTQILSLLTCFSSIVLKHITFRCHQASHESCSIL